MSDGSVPRPPPVAGGRRRSRITLRGWCFLVGGATIATVSHLFDRPSGVSLGLSALVMVAGAGLYLFWPKPPVPIAVRAPRELRLDHDSVIALYLGRTRFTAGSSATLQLSDNLGGPIQVVPDAFRADMSRSLMPIAAIRRGMAVVGPVIVHGFDPLQLISVDQVYGVPADIPIPPRIFPVTVDGSSDGLSTVDGSAPGTQVPASQLRDYVPGDEVRRIHWRGTAKRGRLMVHQNESSTTLSHRIILDSRTTGTGAESQASAGERAVSVAASLAVAQCEAAMGVRLATGSRPIGSIMVSKAKVLQYFTTLPESDPARLREQIQELAGGTRHGVLVAILTDVSADLTALLVEEIRVDRRIALLIRDLGAPPTPSTMLSRLAAAGWRTAIIDGSVNEAGQHLATHGAVPTVRCAP